jgi:hypothetical protein
MWRAMLSLLLLVCIALMSVVAMSCGSSSSPGSGGGGPYNVVGTWQTTLSGTGGSASFVGAIGSSGAAVFFATDNPEFIGDTWQLPSITGVSLFSGETTLYAAPGTELPWGGTSQTVSVQGKVNSSTSISVANSNGSFNLVASSLLPSTVSGFSGVMTGVMNDGMQDGPIFSLNFYGLNFNSSGSATCTIGGSLLQDGSNNVFGVTMDFNGVCPVPSGPYGGGIGFESSTDYFNDNGGQPGTYLYADMPTSTGRFVMEFFKPQ